MDVSRTFFEKYFKLENRNIEVLLRNGKTLKGIIVGYFKGQGCGQPFVSKWRIIEDNNSILPGTGNFSDLPGLFIKHEDINEIHFFEDGSKLKFY